MRPSSQPSISTMPSSSSQPSRGPSVSHAPSVSLAPTKISTARFSPSDDKGVSGNVYLWFIEVIVVLCCCTRGDNGQDGTHQESNNRGNNNGRNDDYRVETRTEVRDTPPEVSLFGQRPHTGITNHLGQVGALY
eukprot:scaffold14109_cov67-Cylindrotheca_fusiformis.AAC.1